MTYIEIIGIAGTGKTFLKNKIENKCQGLNEKEIIIKDYINSNKLNFFQKLKSYFFLVLYSKNLEKLKSLFKKKNIIYTHNSNKVTYGNSSKSIIFKIIDNFRLNNYYLSILDLQKKVYEIENIEIYKTLNNIIDKSDQNFEFKKNLKNAVSNNILTIEILKKNSSISFVADEGLLYRIYLVCKFSKNLKNSLDQALNNYNKFGKVILLEKNVSEIWERSELRRKKKVGFIYENKNEINNEINNFEIFKSMIKNKVDIVSQSNIK